MSSIDRTQRHDRVALPGDPDLDCDVDGVRVQSVIANDDEQELLLRLEGGGGCWRDDSGEIVSVDVVTSMDAWARFPDMPSPTWRVVVDQLQRWRDTAASLWFGAVPGKASALIENRDHYVFLPRLGRPNWLTDEERAA